METLFQIHTTNYDNNHDPFNYLIYANSTSLSLYLRPPLIIPLATVFGIIDDFARILNSTEEDTSFQDDHLTSLTCLNYNSMRRIEIRTSLYQFKSSSYISPPLYSTSSFSQTKSLPTYQIEQPTKQLSCDESTSTITMLFNSLINNSLKWRLHNDHVAINSNKHRGNYLATEMEDKSQSGFFESSLMKHYLSYYMSFGKLKKLAISRFRSYYPKIVEVNAIRLIRLDVPLSIQAGQPLRLRCLFETKGEKLQSLSWYKNGREFYRYQPFERKQPVLAFKLNGVHVDVSVELCYHADDVDISLLVSLICLLNLHLFYLSNN